MVSSLRDWQAFFSTPQRTLLTTHYNPDGDALGSTLALAAVLSKCGHQVQVLLPNRAPYFLAWMPGLEAACVWDRQPKQGHQHLRAAATIVCLDFCQLHRLGPLAGPVAAASAPKVIIDHHTAPEPFATLSLRRPELPATALVLYELLQEIGLDHLIDAAVATALYTGLLTDTGLFQHPCTTPAAHRAAAALMDKGAPAADIYRAIYAQKPASQLRFMAHSLLHRLMLRPSFSSAYLALPVEDFRTFEVEQGATQGMVDHLLELRGVRCAVLLKGHQDHLRLSFRSLAGIDVSVLARTHFQGGGHPNASGGRSELSIADTVAQLDRLLPPYLAAQASQTSPAG